MKKALFVLAAVALCTSPAWAGGRLGLFGTTYTTDEAGDEQGLGVELDIGATRNVDILLRVAVYEEFVTDENPVRYEVQAVPIDLGVRWNFVPDSKFNFHVGGGLVYSVFDFSVDSTTIIPPRGVDIDPETGSFAEVGFQLQFHRNWTFFADGVVRQLETEVEGDDVGLEIDQGVSFTGVSINAGVALTW